MQKPLATLFATIALLGAAALSPLLAQDDARSDPIVQLPLTDAQAPEQTAQDVQGPVDILDLRITATEDRARLVVDLTNPTGFGVTRLVDPYRFIVALEAQGDTRALQDLTPNTALVRGYGVDQQAQDRIEITLALNVPAQIQQSYTLEAFDDQPARLVIDFIPDDPGNFQAQARNATQTENTQAAQAETELDGEQFAPGETSSTSSVRPLIVLDPGHGGVDGGAQADSGLQEKNIVLAFALKLQQLLVESERFDVALTRDTDTFLSLEERVSLARANQADLFISLHADSFDEQDVRGASVYTRGEEATDLLDRILAGNENQADLVAGFGPPEDQPHVVSMMVDLLARETRQRSYSAAQALVDQLEPSIQLRRFPLRQADFFVLQAPEIPSVLIELGFLSNSNDTENLTTDAWLDRVAAALARGVATYFDEADDAA